MAKQRDFTNAQFKAALKRNGFKHEFWGWFADTTGQAPGVSFGGLFYRDGRCARRSTVAKLIKDRDRHIAQNEQQRQAA